MNVAFVNRELLLNRGGGEINDLSIARHLNGFGLDIEFFARVPVFATERYDVERFPIHRIQAPYLYGLSHTLPGILGSITRHVDGRLFLSQLRRQLASADHDILQLTGRPSLIRIRKWSDAAVVYSVRGEISDFYIEELANTDAVVAWGDTIEGLRGRGVELPEVLQLTPGVDVESFKNGDGSTLRQKVAETGETVLLFVGRFVRLKNLTYLIDEFERLCSGREGAYRLVLVGDGPLRDRLERRAANTSVAHRIEIVGQVPHDVVPDYYDASDLFVLSSRSENYPIVLLEAMAAGLRVVAPRTGGIPQIIGHGSNGILYDSHAPGTLADAIKHALSELDRKKTAERNRSRVDGHYSWRSRAQELMDLYERVA